MTAKKAPEAAPKAPKESKLEKRRQERDARMALYRAIPQGEWRELAGMQATQLREMQTNYGLPCAGREVDLSEFLVELKRFLKRNRAKIQAEEKAERPPTKSELADLEWKQERAHLARLERQEREGELLQRDQVHTWLARMSEYLRKSHGRLQREFGEKALRIVSEALDQFDQDLQEFKTDG